jgi:hypothetical protein
MSRFSEDPKSDIDLLRPVGFDLHLKKLAKTHDSISLSSSVKCCTAPWLSSDRF